MPGPYSVDRREWLDPAPTEKKMDAAWLLAPRRGKGVKPGTSVPGKRHPRLQSPERAQAGNNAGSGTADGFRAETYRKRVAGLVQEIEEEAAVER
jgi:hypothetical protein